MPPPSRHAILPATRTRFSRPGRSRLALLAVALLLAGCGGPGSGAEARIGEPAPAITGTALDGTTVDLASFRGKPVIVNVWASWCVPCREEFPLFAEKLATLGPKDGLVMLGVLYKDDPALARKFIADTGATWPTVVDTDGAIAAAYRAVAPPQTYFIDADGVLRAIQIGEVKEEDFNTQYAKISP